MGLVPKSTRSEIRVFHGFTLMKIMGIVVSGGIGFALGSALPYQWLQFVISIGFIVLFCILSGKAPTNPKYTFAKGLAFYFAYLVSRKKLYGVSSEEYMDFCKRRERKNAKKIKRKKEKW